jgi:hypothetical protein
MAPAASSCNFGDLATYDFTGSWIRTGPKPPPTPLLRGQGAAVAQRVALEAARAVAAMTPASEEAP